jgi:hypothetical protein
VVQGGASVRGELQIRSGRQQVDKRQAALSGAVMFALGLCLGPSSKEEKTGRHAVVQLGKLTCSRNAFRLLQINGIEVLRPSAIRMVR